MERKSSEKEGEKVKMFLNPPNKIQQESQFSAFQKRGSKIWSDEKKMGSKNWKWLKNENAEDEIF